MEESGVRRGKKGLSAKVLSSFFFLPSFCVSREISLLARAPCFGLDLFFFSRLVLWLLPLRVALHDKWV
jgi:hypothetical protein